LTTFGLESLCLYLPLEETTTSNPDLLTKFLRAESPREADTALDVLFASVVSPSVKSTLKHKMNVSLSAEDTSARNLDALELVSDVEADLLKKFRSLLNERGCSITNPEAYSKVAATNAFRQYLRDKYPQRRRLRNKIRYIFRNKQDYALWKSDEGEYVCGTEEWKNENRLPNRDQLDSRLRALLVSPSSEAGDIDDNRRILVVLKDILRLTDGPIGLNQTVNIVADVLGLEDPVETEIGNNSATKGLGLEERLIDRWSLEEFWQAIVLLPTRHRTALLLNLRGEHGENALAFFPVLRIASLRNIAEALEISPEELAGIWNKLPLDDNAIAERLSMTRQQVINLRQSARSNLKRKRLEKKDVTEMQSGR